VRKKQGRPEFVYSLTEEGREAGHRDYRKLLDFLLREIRVLEVSDLAGIEGDDLLRFLLGRISQRVNSHHQEAARTSAREKLTHLEQALAQEGFAPEVVQTNGNVQIRLHNCPFRAVALGQEAVCCIDRNLIAGILGVEPEQQSSIRDGNLTCSYLAPLES
jgi:predicted ArsR family transcriptional regulator